MRKSVWFIVGGIIGFGIAIPVTGHYQELALDLVEHIGVAVVYGAIGILILFPVGNYVVKRWIERKFGVKSLHVDKLSSRINEVIWEITSSNKRKARIKTKQLVSDAVSFISHSIYYRWMFTAFVSILVAFGGTLGTVVLLKQNDKISEQTAVIREQNQLYTLEYIKLKSDELDRIIKDAIAVRGLLHDDKIGELAKLYNHGKESICFPLPKADQSPITVVVPTESVSTVTVNDDLRSSWRVKVELLAGSVRAALEGAATDAPHHQASRARLLSSLAITGLPFSIFSSKSFEGSELNSVNLAGANLDKARLDGSHLQLVDFTGVCAISPVFKSVKAALVTFDNGVLIDPDFSNSRMLGSSFKGAQIIGSGKVTSIIGYSSSYGSDDVIEVPNSTMKKIGDIGRAIRRYFMPDSTSVGSAVIIPQLPGFDSSFADFSNTELDTVNFSDSRLDNVIFAYSRLFNSSFNNATLIGAASFQGADLRNTDFRLSSSSMKQLEKSYFTGANFQDAIIDGLDFGNNGTVTKEQLQKGCICGGKYPRLNNEEIRVKSCDVRGSDDLNIWKRSRCRR